MSKLTCITFIGVAAFCSLVTACNAPQKQLTEEDVSPIDYQKMAAFNTWLAEQKKLEPSKAFKAKPMQVSGKGRVRVVPDIAVITGTIETEADQDDTAIDDAAKIINKVQKALDGQDVGLSFTQIGTSEMRDPNCLARNQKVLYKHQEILNDNNYNQNIKRQLERGVDIKVKPKKPKKRLVSEICPVTHIEAKLSFTARVKPASEAGNIINAFTTAGVNQVDLFGYDFSDFDTHYKKASVKAVKDARTKAERVAKIAGTTLTEIVSFRVDAPRRITRTGPQAMIISNHNNRNVAAGSLNFNDQVLTNANTNTRGQFTVFNGTSNQIVQSTETRVSQTGEILCNVQIPAVYKTIFRNGRSERILVEPARQEWKPGSQAINAGALNAGATPVGSTNALKMSLQAGQRTIEVNAYLNYLYETPIDGSVVPDQLN